MTAHLKRSTRLLRGIAVVFAAYVGLYLLLRSTHLIQCYSNAWNWWPDKWDLRHEFDDRSISPCGSIFQPLMAAEISIRVPIATLAHSISNIDPQWFALGLFAVIAACFLGMFWHVMRRPD